MKLPIPLQTLVSWTCNCHNLLFLCLAIIKILLLAKKITGIEDTKAAVMEFKKNISSQDMYFNKEPLPANETGEQAFKLCNSIEGAMKFCPKRWETLQKWFKASREVINLMLDAFCALLASFRKQREHTITTKFSSLYKDHVNS